MCINPSYVHIRKGLSYEKTPVPCRRCWACRKNKVNDLTGLCLGEYAASDWGLALTLTYDDRKLYDPVQAKAIHKHDFQLFMKNVRNDGHKCRYLVAGEYGSRKSRAHFHVLLLGSGKPPRIPPPFSPNRWSLPDWWDYGHVNVDPHIHEASIRYITKYLVKKLDPDNKNTEEISEEWLSWSKRPMLGESYIHALVERQADMRTFPYTLNYLPPGASQKNRYSLRGAAEYKYFDRLFELWPDAIHAPKTEWMHNAFRRYIKKKARREWDYLAKNNALHVQAQILNDEMRVSLLKKIDNAPKIDATLNPEVISEKWLYLETLENQKWLAARGIKGPPPVPLKERRRPARP